LNENEIDEQAGLPTHCGFPIDAMKNGTWKERKGSMDGGFVEPRKGEFFFITLSFISRHWVCGGRGRE
jgi:hypothetical protein